MANKEGFKYKLSKVFDVLGELLAFLTIIVYAVYVTNNTWHYISNETFLMVLGYAKEWAPLLLVSVVGMEFAVKRSFIIQIVIYVLIAFVVIFMFFPGTADAIRGALGI